MMKSFLRKAQLTASVSATQEPLQVTGLTATASGQTTINLSWTADATPAPNGATSYVVERSVDGLGSWSTIGTVTVPTTTFSDTSLSASQTRYYRVSAYNSFGGGLPSASASATTASGTYNVEYLVVAGGGGGSRGGGGAGGYRTATGFSLTPGTSYTITVGAGGAAGNVSTQGVNGSNSVFSTITSTGGGGGGHASNGSSGGSGGGGGSNNVVNYTGGAGTSGQGNAGGNQVHLGSPFPSAGGGGASAAGQATQSNTASGNGGDGSTFYSVVYAGGGGGGTFSSGGTNGSGGSGGGGAGTTAGTAGSGTANRGGGGGGQGNGGTAGAGGSGIVILRVPAANYSGTTTGSPTVTDDGSTKVLTFTASGSYTA